MLTNEIQFLRWTEFRRMAPAILQLEISRISTVLQAGVLSDEQHNALVRGRFALRQFIRCLNRAEPESVEAACAGHLRLALLNVSIEDPALDEAVRETLRYTFDRLSYVHDRIGLIY